MIAHIDLDSFFVAVERSRRPDLAGRPIVIGGQPGSHAAVVAASRDARREGVRVGMTLDEAVRRAPSAACLDGAFDAYFAAAGTVDAVLRHETGEIEWRSIDEIYLGLPTSISETAAVAVIERLQAGVHALGFDAACGLAANKLVARVASRLGHPRGVVHVLEGYERRFLAPLKIEMLPDVDPALVRKLRAAGIRRLGQLVAMSERHLSQLVGRGANVLARQARGVDTGRVIRTSLPPGRLTDRLLPAPTTDREHIRSELRREAERLGHDLRSRRAYARSLTLRVRLADGGRESRTAHLPQPSMLDDALLAGAMDLLGRAWSGERLVRGVSLSASGIVTAPEGARLFA